MKTILENSALIRIFTIVCMQHKMFHLERCRNKLNKGETGDCGENAAAIN